MRTHPVSSAKELGPSAVVPTSEGAQDDNVTSDTVSLNQWVLLGTLPNIPPSAGGSITKWGVLMAESKAEHGGTRFGSDWLHEYHDLHSKVQSTLF